MHKALAAQRYFSIDQMAAPRQSLCALLLLLWACLWVVVRRCVMGGCVELICTITTIVHQFVVAQAAGSWLAGTASSTRQMKSIFTLRVVALSIDLAHNFFLPWHRRFCVVTALFVT